MIFTIRRTVGLLTIIFLIFNNSFLYSQIEHTNKLPVVNIEISPVSKSSMVAPVWVKFYPINTYDPDGTIVLFEMDMNGDKVFDVEEKTLKGSSFEFKTPGVYNAIIKVTDNKGGITIKQLEFIIKEFEDQLVEEQEIEVEIISSDTLNYIPEEEWEETDIPWIDVWNPNGSKIITKKIDSTQIPTSQFKSISPFISIEPQDGKSAVGAIRIKLPEDLDLSNQDKNNVLLAFYEEAFSVSTGETESRWRYHTVDYDEVTDTYVAEMNHGCIVAFGVPILIAGLTYIFWDDATRLLLENKSSSNFVLHYSKKEISETQVKETLEILEKARTYLKKDISLGGLGLKYPMVPVKIDVYYVGIKSKEKKEDIYGLYREAKSGAKWIDLNNPSNIKFYDHNELAATIVHELFHIVQYSKYNNANYLWLNEALSTAAERSFVKSKNFIAISMSPISNKNMYISGLKNMTTDKDGYSAGLFINYLTYRFGNEIFSTILNESKRQIFGATSQDPFKALTRAISRLARKKYTSNKKWADLDFVWQDFTNAFILDKTKPQLIDKRVPYNLIYLREKIIEISISKKEVIKNWDIKVPNLSFVPNASKTFKIKTLEWNNEDKAIIDCTVKFKTQNNPLFDISTRIDFFHRRSEKGYIPNNSITKGKLNNKTTQQSFSLNLNKKDRLNLLSFIPTGLGANAKKGETKASYELTCKIKTEEKIEIDPDVPISSNAIDTYWWAYWKTAVTVKGSSDNKLVILNNSPLDGLYQAALNEWEPINEQIKAISNRKRVIDKKIRPLHDMYSKYNDQINRFSDSINALVLSKNITSSEYKVAGQKLKAMSLSKAKRSLFREINNNYYEATDPSTVVSGISEIFSNIKTIGMKSKVLVYPSRLRYVHIHSKELPSNNEIQSALNKFHKSISKIAPAKKALSDFEKYWMENENEANNIIEEIKQLYPSLK